MEKSNSSKNDVSVIIINWNTCEDLEVCIDSFLKTSDDIKTEIIVVDNASEDRSVSMVQSKFPQVKVIANSCNLGFAAAVNQGIKISNGAFLLILNSDIIAGGGVLKTLVATLQLYPDVAAVAPCLVNMDGTLQTGYFRKYPSLLQVLLFYTFLSKYTDRNPKLVKKYMEDVPNQHNGILEVPQIPGGCIMVNRDVLQKVGLMDEKYFLFFEDVDWCYRMRMNNYRLLKINTVSMVHLGGRSFLKGDNYWIRGRFLLSLNMFVDKFYSIWFQIATKLITVGDSLIVLIYRKIQQTFKKVHHTERWRHSYRRHSYFVEIFSDHYFSASFSKFIKRLFYLETEK